MAIVPNSARILCFYNGSSYYATHFHTNCNAGGSFRLIVCDPSNYANLYVPLGYMAGGGGVTSRPIRVRVTNGGDVQCVVDILPAPIVYFNTDVGGSYGQCKCVRVCCIYMRNNVTTYNCINFYVKEPDNTYWNFIATMPRCGQRLNLNWYICCAKGMGLACSQFKADLIYGNNRVASYCTSNFPICGGLGWRRLVFSTFGNSEYWGNPL